MRFAWSKMASRRELSDAPASFAARHGRKQPETGREASETAPKPSILFDFQCFFRGFPWISQASGSLAPVILARRSSQASKLAPRPVTKERSASSRLAPLASRPGCRSHAQIII